MAIELKPETEQLLKQELTNGRFRSVDEVTLRGLEAGPPTSQLLTREVLPSAAQRVAAFKEWYQSLPKTGVVLPDEAMERSSFYGDRG